MPNPWDRPLTGSPFRKGDPIPSRLHIAVGRALSKWEHLEGEIISLYAGLIGGFNRPAIRAFGTLNSSAARAEMIAAAAEAYFHDLGFVSGVHPENVDINEFEAIELQLREILKTYKGWMSRRNDIAHGLVWQVGPEDDNSVSYLLYPSDGSTNKWCVSLGEPAFAYDGKHIDAFGEAFAAIEEMITKFRDRLVAFDEHVKASIP